jgi:hypothetical protein
VDEELLNGFSGVVELPLVGFSVIENSPRETGNLELELRELLAGYEDVKYKTSTLR